MRAKHWPVIRHVRRWFCGRWHAHGRTHANGAWSSVMVWAPSNDIGKCARCGHRESWAARVAAAREIAEAYVAKPKH